MAKSNPYHDGSPPKVKPPRPVEKVGKDERPHHAYREPPPKNPAAGAEAVATVLGKVATSSKSGKGGGGGTGGAGGKGKGGSSGGGNGGGGPG